jgi:hypothetical protein
VLPFVSYVGAISSPLHPTLCTTPPSPPPRSPAICHPLPAAAAVASIGGHPLPIPLKRGYCVSLCVVCCLVNQAYRSSRSRHGWSLLPVLHSVPTGVGGQRCWWGQTLLGTAGWEVSQQGGELCRVFGSMIEKNARWRLSLYSKFSKSRNRLVLCVPTCLHPTRCIRPANPPSV